MIALVSAPSNLGLRPPQPGSVPGTAKAPDALREAGMFAQFLARGAIDAGAVLPGRYVDDDAVRPPGRVRNQEQLVLHARRLASRINDVLEAGRAPMVIGGDCSLLVGTGLALTPRADVGLIHIDGHTDFRHPGNSERFGSVAGEDLAAVVGLHLPAVADIDGLGPYFTPTNVAHIGCREDDEHAAEAQSVLGLTVPAQVAMARGMTETASTVRAALAATAGYWIQIDVDVLDPMYMPAVDSPDPGGIDPEQLIRLLSSLAPGAIGASVTVFDPDLDPDGQYATLLTEILLDGMSGLGSEIALSPRAPLRSFVLPDALGPMPPS